MSGQSGGHKWTELAPGTGSRAWLNIDRLHDHFAADRKLVGLVLRVAAGEQAPQTHDELDWLRDGLRECRQVLAQCRG